MKVAVLDLGTNTFHLLIAEKNGQAMPKTIFRERRFVKIGQGGINKGVIAPDAYQRALDAMIAYGNIITQHHVDRVIATATSAIRSAQNGAQLLADIKKQAGITPKTISGDREAELIFEGVKWDVGLDQQTVLVMDIGGGSVEFVIGNTDNILWKRSFEIGAQRLYDLFHHQEPIGSAAIAKLNNYLTKQLIELKEAIQNHQPQLLIGSSGTFDTVWEVFDSDSSIQQMTYRDFLPIHQLFISKTLGERLAIKGMLAMRAEMIVVASCLLDFVFQQLPNNQLKISNAALKEGVLATVFAGGKI